MTYQWYCCIILLASLSNELSAGLFSTFSPQRYDDQFMTVYDNEYDHTFDGNILSYIMSHFASTTYIAIEANDSSNQKVVCIDTIAEALPTTSSTTVAYAGSVGGVFWYRVSSYSFGCSTNSTIDLSTKYDSIDLGAGGDKRISWRLDGNAGGRIESHEHHDSDRKMRIYVNKCGSQLTRPCTLCINGFYVDSNGDCSPCHESCLTCVNGTSKGCTSCNNTLSYYNNTAVPAYCTKSSGCTTNCLYCIDTDSDKCVLCNNGYYPSTIPGSCSPCHSSCSTCDAGGATDCLTCNTTAGFSLNASYPNYCVLYPCPTTGCSVCFSGMASSCLLCSNRYYNASATYPTSCNGCNSVCATCINGTSCSTCFARAFINSSNLCEYCYPTCETCHDATYLGCDTCRISTSDYMYNSSFCAHDSNCISTCSTCLGITLSGCVDCKPTYFLASATLPTSCSSCHVSCLECSSNSATACSSCRAADTYYRNTSFPTYCVKNTCLFNCKICYSDLSGSCMLCNDKYFLATYSAPSWCSGCMTECATCDNGTTCLTCVSHHIFNSSNNHCDQCHSSCLECSNTTSLGCLSCDSDYAFYEAKVCAHDSVCTSHCSKCVGTTTTDCVICGSNYYLISSYPTSCSQCHISCQECLSNSPLNCQCKTSASYNLNALYPNYCVKTTCIDNCDVCFSDTVGNCLKCKIKYYLTALAGPSSCTGCMASCASCSNGVTCTSCNAHHFLNSSSLCEVCHPSCLNCSSNSEYTCDGCNTDYSLFDSTLCIHNSSCITNCAWCFDSSTYDCVICMPHYFLENSYPDRCISCHASCLHCTSKSYMSCISCSTDFSFDLIYPYACTTTSNTICNNDCEKCIDTGISDCFQCKDKFYGAAYLPPFKCLNCLPECATCLNNLTCLTCVDYYYITPQKTCLPCYSSCKTCSGPSPFDCIICEDGYSKTDGLCSHNISCYTNCDICIRPGLMDCVRCNQHYYLSNTAPKNCLLCHRSCLNCTGVYATQCSNCYIANGFNQVILYSPYCSTTSNCAVGCAICYDYNPQSCLKSKDGFYPYSLPFPFISLQCSSLCLTCLNGTYCYSCITHHYLNSNSLCSQCHPSCNDCHDNASSSCIDCNNGYIKNGSFCVRSDICISSCQLCVSSVSYDCIACKENYYITGALPAQCIPCHSSCKYCNNNEPTQCIQCQDGYYRPTLNNQYCVTTLCADNCIECITIIPYDCEWCADGYYKESMISKCFMCPAECSKCNYESLIIKCSECSSHYYIDYSLSYGRCLCMNVIRLP